MIYLKLRKTPPEHAHNWILTFDGTVIDGYDNRVEAIDEAALIADKTRAGLKVQRGDGRWETPRPYGDHPRRSGQTNKFRVSPPATQ